MRRSLRGDVGVGSGDTILNDDVTKGEVVRDASANNDDKISNDDVRKDDVVCDDVVLNDGSTSNDDVTISVEGQTIICSRAVLVKESDYFRAMFDSNMVECRTGEAKLHDQKYDVVNTLVQCMKTGELKIEDDVTELLHTAVMLQIKCAIDNCVSYLKKTLDDNNCFSHIRVAKSYILDDLYSHAKRHALYFFNQVITHQEFLELELAEVIVYLSDMHLNCESEVNVLNAIQRWCDHDKVKRCDMVGEVLQKCFHPEDLLEGEWEKIRKHGLLTDTDAGVAWLQENKHHKKVMTCKDQYRKLPVMFLSIGGACAQQKYCRRQRYCEDICKFDEEKKVFSPFMSLREIYPKMSPWAHDETGPDLGFTVTVVGKDLYLTGGQQDIFIQSEFETGVWKLDGFELKWERVTSLPFPWKHHGACASKSSLYLMGGLSRSPRQERIMEPFTDEFVEYDIIHDEWHKLPHMLHSCFIPQAVYCLDKIYVYTYTKTSCYDFNTSSWTLVSSIPGSATNSNIPHKFGNYIYEFPWQGMTYDNYDNQCARYDLETLTYEEIQFSDKFQFGCLVVVCNRKFYMLDRDDQNFVSGSFDNLQEFTLLGSQGQAGIGCYLVALPCYPEYKIKLGNTVSAMFNIDKLADALNQVA